MIIEYVSFSEIGLRDSNQDRLLVPATHQGDRFTAAIADGIGGAFGGAEAAQIAVDAAAAFTGFASDLSTIFDTAARRIRQISETDPRLSKMGTTLTVALIEDGMVHVAHVGDTRVYHLRGSGLNTLTKDQTEVAELLRKGVLSERQAKRYPRKNVLISALTPKAQYEVQLARAPFHTGDRLLLITDGVYQRLTRGSILNTSLAHNSVNAFGERLKTLAKEAEPSDNYSAVAIDLIG